MKEKAVVILSGGLDSTTCMGIAAQKYELYPVTFDYNQRHRRELESAKLVSRHYNVEKRHKIIDVSFLGELGCSSLTDNNMSIQEACPIKEQEQQIPDTYVPARNLIFIAMSTAYAETLGAKAIYIGVSAVDYSGYPDCRPDFIDSMRQSINFATKLGISDTLKLEAPLINMSKEESIKLGLELGVPYKLTTSCYNGRANACGKCDSCRLRLAGFEACGVADPIEYEAAYV